jgi:hypothetical protein
VAHHHIGQGVAERPILSNRHLQVSHNFWSGVESPLICAYD